jgi:2'-5' RNA ligase
MDMRTPHLPGYAIHEYRLVIPLPEALQERIQELRRKLYEQHNLKYPFQLKPSLTVGIFHAFLHREARVLERLESIALGLHPFKVELRNFSAYPTHTIFIDLPTRQPFHHLAEELKALRSLVKVPDHDPQFIREPHLLMAQKLKPFQFIRLWMECEQKQFTGRFIADSLLLLHKSPLSSRFEVLRRFDFRSVPQAVRQGELFQS